MAFNDLELKRTENAIDAYLAKHRPSVHIRAELDIECRIEGQSVVVYEVRPQWRNPNEKIYLSVAKTTFVRTQNTWKVYWQRADLKWYQYEPQLQVKNIDEFFTVLAEDEFSCFWG